MIGQRRLRQLEILEYLRGIAAADRHFGKRLALVGMTGRTGAPLGQTQVGKILRAAALG